MTTKRNWKVTFINLFVFLTIVGFIAVLAAYAYMGSFMRTIGDDYCLGGTLQKHGLFGGVVHAYFNPVPYHGNRFTLIFLSLFFALFHPKFNGVLPFLTIIFFSSGLYLLIQTIFSKQNIQLSKIVTLLLSVAVVFFTLWLAPSVEQNLYWRTGMLSTLAPVIGNIFLFVFILRINSSHPIWRVVVLILSIINGGITETGAAFQAMTGTILLFWAIFDQYKNSNKRKSLIIDSSIIVIGSIIAVILMWVSPSIVRMKEEISFSLFETIIMSMSHSLDFYFGFFSSVYLAVLALLTFGLLTFFLIFYDHEIPDKLNNKKPAKWLALAVFSQLAVFLLIFSIMMPSALTRNVYPDPRHLLSSVFAFILGSVIFGFCLGGIADGFISNGRLLSVDRRYYVVISSGLLFLFSILYPVRYIPRVTSDRLIYQYWAYQWDRRHDYITQSVASGIREVNVMTLDHIIEGVGELSPEFSTNWYNLCAADYYGLDRVFADQEGWEEGFGQFLNNQ